MRALLVFSLSALLCSPLLSNEPSPKGYSEVKDLNTLKILTPSLAEREYSKIELDNGLSVFLVSDSGARKSAAALCVHRGSWSDPSEYPGMAHFLEHMLFMGTKAYPNENDFMQYVGDHGGSTNAFTAPDRTVYSFTVNNDSFEGGLHRFAHFFIDPLFQTSGVQRELHAVDQEHAKNIRTDARRKWMIFKETGNQQHPNKAFGTGNAKTLGHIPRDALVSWYQQYYLAQEMFLVIYSSMPMQELKQLAVKDFSEIPGTKNTSPLPYAPLSSSVQKGHITYIKPIKDLKTLSLDWELPKQDAVDLDTQSANLIAYTLSSGSENSLIEDLKQNFYAESLTSSVQEFSTENKFLNITISLTKEGVQEIDSVIMKCFQAINGLKKSGIPKYLFNEMQTMNRINYEYQGREDAFEYVTDAAYTLASEPLETFPMKNTVATQYSVQNIQKLLDLLTPQNCLFTVLASPDLTGIVPDRKEKWNGGEYTIKKISASYLKTWDSSSPSKHISLPLQNPYIPENLTLINKGAHSESDPPYMISHNEYGKNYVWEDSYYEVPEISFKIGLKSPSIATSAKSQALLDLLIKTYEQKLAPLLSVAERAGLRASLSPSDLKLNLNIGGYSEKADEFLKSLLIGLKTLSCSEKEFTIYKDSLSSEYENSEKAQPYAQGAEILSNILYNDAPLASAKRDALKNCTYEDFIHFLSQLTSVCYIEGLYAGNLTKKNAESVIQKIQSTLNFSGYPIHEHHEKQLLLLPKNDGPYIVTEKITALGNAALLAIQEGPFSYEKKASQLILNKALSESFFDTLRSKQQTGYITATWTKEVEKQLLQFFVVQSATHEPEDLISRFEIFLETFVKDFTKELPEERFSQIANAQIDQLKKPLPNLSEMSSYLYNLAFQKEGQFDYNNELITAIQNLSYKQLLTDAKDFLSRKNSKRLAVLVEGDIPGDRRFQYHKITSDGLKRIGTYVSSN